MLREWHAFVVFNKDSYLCKLGLVREGDQVNTKPSLSSVESL